MPPAERPRRVVARRIPRRITRRRRGRGVGYQNPGNTTLDIEFRINGQLDKKISAVNTRTRDNRMRFRIKNTDISFMHFADEEWIEAFKTMIQRVT